MIEDSLWDWNFRRVPFGGSYLYLGVVGWIYTKRQL